MDLMTRREASRAEYLFLDDHVNRDDPSSPTVRDTLINQHPPDEPAYNACILPDEPEEVHPVIFDNLDANLIRSAAWRVKGACSWTIRFRWPELEKIM